MPRGTVFMITFIAILCIQLLADLPSASSQHPRIREKEIAIYPPVECDFENATYQFDEYSDSRGLRPYPWGFEVWGGKPIIECDRPIAHKGEKSVQITGNNLEDMVVLAIPELPLKPMIVPGRIYRVEAWVKMDNVGGQGVRLMQQFFNSSKIEFPRYRFFGEFVKGSCDWTRMILDSSIDDPDMIKGDPVVQFWGIGTIWIDEVKFYEVQPQTPRMTQPLARPTLKIQPLSRVLVVGESVNATLALQLEGADKMFLRKTSFVGDRKDWVRIREEFIFSPSSRLLEILLHVPREAKAGNYTIRVVVTSETEEGIFLPSEGLLELFVVEDAQKPAVAEGTVASVGNYLLPTIAAVLIVFLILVSYVARRPLKGLLTAGSHSCVGLSV